MYFSFVASMTWQVSDVQVKSKSMRKIVILHSFDVTLVALAINIVASEIWHGLGAIGGGPPNAIRTIL